MISFELLVILQFFFSVATFIVWIAISIQLNRIERKLDAALSPL